MQTEEVIQIYADTILIIRVVLFVNRFFVEVGNELMARLNSVLLKSVGGIPSSNLEIGPFENLVIRLLFANWTETDPWNFEDAEYIYSSPFVTGDHSTT